MHSTTMLSCSDFSVEIQDQRASIDDLFPGLNEKDRIGFILHQAGGSVGASALLLAAVTRFYEFYRERLGDGPEQLRIYPEIFMFHIGTQHLNHYWLDVWPPHKEVVVEDDPEQILEAVNDRGITRLIVEDLPAVSKIELNRPMPLHNIPSSTAIFLRETLASAEQRIITALAYSHTGRVEQPDVAFFSCRNAEKLLSASLESSNMLTEEIKEKLWLNRQALQKDGRIKETFRRIKVADALCMLTQTTRVSEATQQYISMLES
ncbi:hypothetical protein M3221_22060 [Domibacillus indicus]|uniref:hypothetical protein n=1 Tax=Domibacillus indicus TaxID=1437523 RepID=UPI00203BE2C3|nr:hypothetical protein [Domibacillus indicus]MCM3791028.1 hypothetical protein [Domibacillus indicus]